MLSKEYFITVTESAIVCAVDGSGRIVREAKRASEARALIARFGGLDIEMARIDRDCQSVSKIGRVSV
jgi:hypothetical protein